MLNFPLENLRLKVLNFMVLLVLPCGSLLSQTSESGGSLNPHADEPCGFATVIQQLEAQYPGFRLSYDQQTLNAKQSDARKLRDQGIDRRKKVIKDTLYYYDTIYTVPVVFLS